MDQRAMAEEWMTTSRLGDELKAIGEKVLSGTRISAVEGLALFRSNEAAFAGMLANALRERRHGNNAYYNRNIHIEPTNICVFDCKFCAYSRLFSQRQNTETWELGREEILNKVKQLGDEITEVHIVGGVHPRMGLDYFAQLIADIKSVRPGIQVKAFTAVELEYMCRKAGVRYAEGLKTLMDAGQVSLPGGGAEIFDETLRREICRDKCSSQQWLDIHRSAHTIGMHSNATMLYGHMETFEHRLDHLSRLRQLQDETGGFQCFIPLKFRNGNNQMSHISETGAVDDLMTFAVSRIFLDNFEHIKAYWPMCGREMAQLALGWGADDIDGTINDSTRIYSMAGAEEQKPAMQVEELRALIHAAGREPLERNTLYEMCTPLEMSNSEKRTE